MAPDPGATARDPMAYAAPRGASVALQDVNPETRIGAGNMRRLLA